MTYEFDKNNHQHSTPESNLYSTESHLDSGAPAFTNSIGHSSTRGVNHGHKANEAQLLGGEVHLIGVESKAHWELVIRQVEMPRYQPDVHM
uniref:Uncharacterized protein n=1 Tax=Echeneis naucrates TaxID=173247 RepID=A0A665X3U4_ECHNA